MSSLRTRLETLAASFAIELVHAIQGSSLAELRNEVAGASWRGRSGDDSWAASTSRFERERVDNAAGGRLRRRSAQAIEAALANVVELLNKHERGLRAEQIRKALHMQAKEMPRVLAEGLDARRLRKTGQKRSTTYFST